MDYNSRNINNIFCWVEKYMSIYNVYNIIYSYNIVIHLNFTQIHRFFNTYYNYKENSLGHEPHAKYAPKYPLTPVSVVPRPLTSFQSIATSNPSLRTSLVRTKPPVNLYTPLTPPQPAAARSLQSRRVRWTVP